MATKEAQTIGDMQVDARAMVDCIVRKTWDPKKVWQNFANNIFLGNTVWDAMYELATSKMELAYLYILVFFGLFTTKNKRQPLCMIHGNVFFNFFNLVREVCAKM